MTASLRLSLLMGALATFFGLISTGSAHADLRACNQTNQTISIAIGYKDNETWTSEGWWTMSAGDCKNVVPGDLENRYYYLRATLDGQPLPTEDFYFCTSSKVFTIVGDTECEERGYDRVAFSQIDTGDAKAYTIEVSSTPEAVDDLGDIRAMLQGNWYAEQDPQFLAFIEGDQWSLVDHGEQLDTATFEVDYTCLDAEGDGPVLLFSFPYTTGLPECWLLINSTPEYAGHIPATKLGIEIVAACR